MLAGEVPIRRRPRASGNWRGIASGLLGHVAAHDLLSALRDIIHLAIQRAPDTHHAPEAACRLILQLRPLP